MGKNIRWIYWLAAVLLLAVTGLFAACGSSEDEAEWPAMEELSAWSATDITEIGYTRTTEDGVVEDTVTNEEQIEEIYLRLKDVSISGRSDMAAEDDGLDISVNVGETMLHFSFEGDILRLEDGTRYEVENLSPLKEYIDDLIKEKAAARETTQAETSGGNGSSEPYDIEKGGAKQASKDGSIVYIYFNDFMMTMPNNDKYSYEAKGDSVSFYLWAAQQEGYGGHLVTIRAYDLDDDSYKQLPSYHVAGVGKNVNKRFIAIYPTDVQWNNNDAEQTADYKDLENYLQKIGEGAVNSPLQTADSD